MTTMRADTLLMRDEDMIPNGSFLNLDLQGAELLALRGLGEMLWWFEYVYVEVNERELYQGCPLVREIDDYLSRFGFSGMEVKMTNHGWGDKFYRRRIP